MERGKQGTTRGDSCQGVSSQDRAGIVAGKDRLLKSGRDRDLEGSNQYLQEPDLAGIDELFFPETQSAHRRAQACLGVGQARGGANLSHA